MMGIYIQEVERCKGQIDEQNTEHGLKGKNVKKKHLLDVKGRLLPISICAFEALQSFYLSNLVISKYHTVSNQVLNVVSIQ